MGEYWAQLPRESRTSRLLAPDSAWGDAEWLLWSVEHSLRVLVWRQVTRDGQKGRNMPRPIDTPRQVADARRRRDSALAARAEIDRALGMTVE